ncbi:MAG: 7-carboxy-7-deazaguanine synthase QueE [Acidobacteriota bacterium]|nr:7-carboxy-7-deazaguanine synthase QueE [Acidobacteriota bacterium]MDW3229255.1 7-carboxy-7-deazaguanine synthase QueE [Acidobacteriota bacterium]
MLLRPTLKISEIFFSAEGEGLRQGEPAIFVRLAGCNLRCDFCDTKYAWNDGREMPLSLILSKITTLGDKYKTRWVSLTGGEPLLQEIRPLVSQLKKAGFKIKIETNGTQLINSQVSWLTVSPKPPDYFSTQDCRKMANEVKLVVTKNLSLALVEKIRKDFSAKIPLLLQPQSNQDWSYQKAWWLFQKSLKAGLKNIRLSCQLHIIYGLK